MMRLPVRRLALAVLWTLLGVAVSSFPALGQEAGVTADTLRLTLPPQVYGVAGQPFTVYPENLILTETPEKYRVRFTLERDGQPVDLGRQEPRRWVFQPTETHVGRFKLAVAVSTAENETLAAAQTTLVISPANTGANRSLSLLIVGDSLTHATLYPNELARLLAQPGNPQWSMLGTHRPASAKPGVAHEGYGGWTWEAFAARYSAEKSNDGRRNSSPFVFVDAQGQPQLNPARFFDDHCDGKRPDVITFLLGINDCFSAPPDDPQKLDERIDAVFVQAEKVLTAMRQAAPGAALAICLTPPPNVREEAFVANYKGRYPRWGWRKIQHRLVERQIKHFGGREQDGIYLVPTELNVDPVDGYPVDNGVHPNAVGYAQVADSLYAWLKWRMNRPE